MTTFYICRHGETENNQNSRLSGWIDTPLTEKGEREALSSSAKLKDITIDLIVTSDLGRSFITGYIIARHIGYKDDVKRLHDLREVNYGVLANQPYDSYPNLSATENAEFKPDGGESLAQMQKRVLTCTQQLAAENDGKIVLLVAHDGTINAVLSSYNHKSIGETDASGDNANGFLARFVFENGKVNSFETVQT